MPDARIQSLIDELHESEFVEVKNWLGGLEENNERARLAKEVIALANSGGGHIFIGFEDERGHGHQPITPNQNEVNAFTQDTVQSLVERYCTPAIQCNVTTYRQNGRNIEHPVISVPASGRVPIFATRQSPDNHTLINGTVYIRRPGGYSEPCRTQDDWERLLERLVHARQDQLINAIRNVLNPEQSINPEPQGEAFEAWLRDCRLAREDALDETLPAGHALRLEQGYYEVAFSIRPFQEPDIADLNVNLDNNRPRHSGWAPFVVLHREGMRPRPMGDVIQAWLLGDEPLDRDPFFSDFWRLSIRGDGYLVRAMQEDEPSYGDNIWPRPIRPSFDWTFPIYRMTEILKLIEWLGMEYADEDANFHLRIEYFGASGRSLSTHNLRYALERGAVATQNSISSQISGRIGDIALNSADMVFTLLRPVYSQFQFTQLPRPLVDRIVHDAEQYRQ